MYYKKYILSIILSLLLFACSEPNDGGFDPAVEIDDTMLSNSLKGQYWEDASRLALREIIETHHASEDSIFIPEDIVRKYYFGLVAVYNSSGLHEQFSFRTWPTPQLFKFLISADTSTGIAKAWIAGDTLSGNAVIDSIIQAFDLRLVRVSTYNYRDYCYVSFSSDIPLNLHPLTSIISEQDEVRWCSTSGIGGDGADIKGYTGSNYLSLIYSYRWGDCPSGCIYEHIWEYNVYFNGAVNFLGDYGTPLNG